MPKRETFDGMTDRMGRLEKLLGMIIPVPADWLGDGSLRTGPDDVGCTVCSSYADMINAWHKAMKWTEGLDCALSVMLASIVSTKTVGDQLWIKIMGPASCGKSTLCEAVSVNKKYVLAKSTIRGFHSGYKTDKHGDEDHSLIEQVRDKTLVTKDGDSLLQTPNRDQILSEARDLYDCTSRSHYRHGVDRTYEGVRMTWLLCGTASLRALDSSELGERFLDCVIMESIDDQLEDEILWRVANRANSSLSIEADGKPETQYDPALMQAMSLTGGYINYLRENSVSLLSKIDIPEQTLRRCTRLGKFIAYMRARPSYHQRERAEREFAARLVSQITRMAKCLAAVLNRQQVDVEVMRRVVKVAMDTSRGQTLEILKLLSHSGNEGVECKALAHHLNRTDVKVRSLLYFLKEIGVTTVYHPKRSGVTYGARWRLTPQLTRLWAEITDAYT